MIIYLIISKNFGDSYSIAICVELTFAEALKKMLTTDRDFIVVVKSEDHLEDKLKALDDFEQQFRAAEKEHNKTAKSDE